MSRKRDRASRSEIEARRLSVERFWIRGISPSEIAKRLDVSDQTVYRDFGTCLRKRSEETVTIFTPNLLQ